MTADLELLREGIKGHDPSAVPIPAGYVVIKQATLVALIDECEAARAHRCGLPASIVEALNSGDGTYRP